MLKLLLIYNYLLSKMIIKIRALNLKKIPKLCTPHESSQNYLKVSNVTQERDTGKTQDGLEAAIPNWDSTKEVFWRGICLKKMKMMEYLMC